MNYDVFVSYSVTFSSRAYELSAQLGGKGLTCYLDCVESGFSLSDYTRGLVAESRLHVVLAGTGFVATPYAMATLQCALDAQKRMVVCLADGAKLPEELLAQCEVSAEATLTDDIVGVLTGTAAPAPTAAIANIVGMLADADPADAIAEPVSEPVVVSKPEAEAPSDTYLYAPFSPVGEESPFESAPLDDEDNNPIGCDEDDVEEVVYTEHRGEEWTSPSQETPPSPEPEISPNLQKYLRIAGWMIFIFWLLRLCS